MSIFFYNFLFETIFHLLIKSDSSNVPSMMFWLSFGVYVGHRAVSLQLTTLDYDNDLFFEQYNGEKTNE